MKNILRTLAYAGIVTLGVSGCTQTQMATTAGAGLGAGIGAVASGGNAGATLVGAGVGGLGGYLVGRDMERRRPRR